MDIWIALGSIIAVLGVAALVAWLKLGETELADEDAARQQARDLLPGFDPREVLLGADRQAALVVGADRRVAIIKRHGAQFAARFIATPLDAERDGQAWLIDSGERTFGRVRFIPSVEGADKLLTMM